MSDEDASVQSIVDMIETDLRLADAYRLHGEVGLMREHLENAWRVYLANVPALRDYCGTELSDKIVRAMAETPRR